MGTFQAVRNPAHHSVGDGEPVAAFEDLVALSKVARWVDTWYLDEFFERIEATQGISGLEEFIQKTTSST